MINHHGMNFATFDNDTYLDPMCGGCPVGFSGGYWYNCCFQNHPTGPIVEGGGSMAWLIWTGYKSLKTAWMMIRPWDWSSVLLLTIQLMILINQNHCISLNCNAGFMDNALLLILFFFENKSFIVEFCIGIAFGGLSFPGNTIKHIFSDFIQNSSKLINASWISGLIFCLPVVSCIKDSSGTHE